MDMEDIRRRWGAWVRTMPLTIPVDIERVCAALGAQRGRVFVLDTDTPLAGWHYGALARHGDGRHYPI